MTKSEAASYLFKSEFSPSWQTLEELLPHLEGYKYQFLGPAEYEQLLVQNTAQAMAVYWREILHRAHWAASASLIRTHRWLSGLLDAFLEENLIVFSACTRGLIEACADSWHSLNPVAPTLASAKNVVVKALKEDLDQVITVKDIEDLLIHFTFARKSRKGEVLPDNHAAQTIAEYLRVLEVVQPSIREFYARLCDVVHPGASSVVSFASPLDPKAATVMLTFKREPQVLAEFAVAFRIMLADIMATGFNIGMLTLRTLNALPATEVHTPFLESVEWKPSPVWDKIESLLADDKDAN